MDEKPIVSGVKHFAEDYTTMEYIFPAFLIFGACIMFFFLLLAIFGNDKVILNACAVICFWYL